MGNQKKTDDSEKKVKKKVLHKNRGLRPEPKLRVNRHKDYYSLQKSIDRQVKNWVEWNEECGEEWRDKEYEENEARKTAERLAKTAEKKKSDAVAGKSPKKTRLSSTKKD